MTFSVIRTFLTAFIAVCICCYCTKEDEKNQLARQEKDIDTFITSDTSAAKKINRDTVITVTHKRTTNRIVWNPGTSDTLAVGDTVVFAYVAYVFRAGTGKGAVYATNLPKAINTPVYFPDYGKNAVGKGYYIPGLDAGLVGMRAGEYAYIIFTSQYGYGNKELSTIPKMSPLMFEVEVSQVIKKK